MEKNVVIIGAGPSGVSAALYLKRANINVTVIYKGIGSLNSAELIENYYGFSKPISGEDLFNQGIEGAKRIGVNFIIDEVVGINYQDKLIVNGLKNNYEADYVIIATGIERNIPKIKGVLEFEKRGLSYCAVCDAFFYRNKTVCVIGDGEYAKHEAEILEKVAKKIYIFTNGKKPTVDFSKYEIVTEKIVEIYGDKKVLGVKFENQDILVDGVFVAIGIAGCTSLAKKIGANVENNKIKVNDNKQTNIPKLYAIGDCIGGLLQVSKAVYDGALAAKAIIQDK